MNETSPTASRPKDSFHSSLRWKKIENVWKSFGLTLQAPAQLSSENLYVATYVNILCWTTIAEILKQCQLFSVTTLIIDSNSLIVFDSAIPS